MTILKTDKQKKRWIKSKWKKVSGKMITKMLQRYWRLDKEDLIETAKKIFEV